MRRADIPARVAGVAAAALAERKFVTAIDVLIGLGWLPQSGVDRWRQGRVAYLEAVIGANLAKVSAAIKALAAWAHRQGLKPSETAYVARTRDRRRLRFSKSGAAAIERAYRTHWVSPELSERKRQRLAERQSRPPELVVVVPLHPDWTCVTCGGSGDLLTMQDAGPTCLACARLDHLEFLPAGDAALTRRAHQGSGLTAVVVRFSRRRKRYERQGLLVEKEALTAAERARAGPADSSLDATRPSRTRGSTKRIGERPSSRPAR